MTAVPVGHRASWRNRVVPVAVGLLAALVYAVRVGRPSPWRDEVATIDAVRRSPAGILDLTSRIDAVHAAYYLLAHVVADLDPGPVRVLDGRLVSLVAMAVVAGGTVVLGRRTDRALTGLLAGLFVAVSPLASRYAQEARPFALAAALAVLATVALLNALDSPTRWRWALYGLAVVALGAVEVLTLLVVVVHAAMVLTRPAGPVSVAGRRTLLRGWSVAGLAAAVVLSPLLVLVISQRGQIAALGTPSPSTLAGFGGKAVGSATGVALLGAAFVLLVVRAVWTGRAGRAGRAGWTGRTGRAARQDRPRTSVRALLRSRRTILTGWTVPVVWGVGTPVLLWLVSQADPLFRERYVLFALPGIALLVGRVLARIPIPVAAVTLVAVAGTGLPTQVAIRGTGGHGEDIRALDRLVAAQRRPGDAVVFVPRSTRRVTQLEPPVWSGLADRTADPGLPARRVLLVEHSTRSDERRTGTDAATEQTLAREYRAAGSTRVTGFRLTVYVRRTAAGQ